MIPCIFVSNKFLFKPTEWGGGGGGQLKKMSGQREVINI